MLMLIFIIGSGIIQCVQSVENVDCNDIEVVNCRRFPQLFNYTSEAPATDKEAIEAYCPSYDNVDKYYKCAEFYKQKCLKPYEVDHYKRYLEISPAIDLCAEDSFYRPEYLKYAKCMRGVHTQYISCFNDYQRAVFDQLQDFTESFGLEVQHLPEEDRHQIKFPHMRKLMCEFFGGYLQCVLYVVRSACEENLVPFARQFELYKARAAVKGCKYNFPH